MHESISAQKFEWLSSSGAFSSRLPAVSRLAIVMNIISSTARPSDPSSTILDAGLKLKKLHDGEPALVVEKLDSIPGFWTGFPARGALTEVTKRAFVGEVCAHFLRRIPLTCVCAKVEIESSDGFSPTTI